MHSFPRLAARFFRAVILLFLVGQGLVAADLPTILPRSDVIYETNYRSNTVQMFSLTGQDLGVFATLPYPTGIVFDNDGSLYVSSDNPGAYLIEKFAPDGSGTVFANSGLDGPHALVFDRMGNLYVANPRSNTIEQFAPGGSGTVFADVSDGLQNPLDLAFDSAGNLYVSNSYGGPTGKGSVEKFTPDGTGSIFADAGFHIAYGLAFDQAGNLYVSNYNSSTIEKFSPTGTDLGLFASAGVNAPHGMLFGPGGNLYVINNGTNSIEKLSPTGADLGLFASTGVGPHFLTTFRPTHLHFEIESLRKQGSSAPLRILSDPEASGGAYALLKATSTGDFISYKMPVPAPGTYDIKVGIQTGPDRGIFQLAIAGINQSTPEDEYSATTAYQSLDLGAVTFENAGTVVCRFTVTGSNLNSSGYTLALDYIELDRTP